jgi:hypothetical protein
MGIVLVAALVVPLAVIPGTFGFDRWPSSRGERVTESQVRLAPPKVAVVQVHPRSAPAPQRVLASVSTGAVVVRAPSRPDTRRQHASSPPAHQDPPPAPAAQPEPQQPSKNDSGILAGGDPPVARQLPPADPTPPQPPVTAPSPVEHAVPPPVERVTPSEPCHGHGDGGGDGHGGQGDGDNQE